MLAGSSPAASGAEGFAGGLRDMTGGDPRRLHELLGGPGAAAATSVSVSIGFTEYRSRTRARMPSRPSCSAAARQLCNVTPAPTSVTWSSGLDRTTFAPPTGKASSGPYSTGYAPRVVRR